MPTTSEVSTRLSADNSNYRSVMNDTVKVTENAGRDIMKKLDLRAGVTAIAAAIGFNIQSIAEGVARFVTGMSKEVEDAFNKIDSLVARNADASIANMRRMASAETQYQLLLQERERILARMNEPAAEPIKVPAWVKFLKAVPILGPVIAPGIDVGMRVAETAAEKAAAKDLLKKEEAKARLIELDGQIREIEKAKTKEMEKQEATIGKQTSAIEKQVVAVGEVKDAVAEIAPVIESNIEKWKNFSALITSTGRSDKELTDRELQRKIANLQQDIFARRTASNLASASIGGGIGGYDPLLGAQQSNLQQTLAEINLRRNVRRRAGALGEDAAFAQFSGLTEQRFREILQGIDTSSTGKLASAIDKLNQRLDQPLETISVNRPSPFGTG